MRKFLYILISALAFASCSMSDDDAPASDLIVRAGDRVPSFTVIMNDNTQFTTSNLGGKPCVIVFFSTTCGDCRRELPVIDQRYRAHGADTTFVAIAREQAAADIAAYWEANDLLLPFSPQEDREVYALFAKSGIPRVITVNSRGVIESCW